MADVNRGSMATKNLEIISCHIKVDHSSEEIKEKIQVLLATVSTAGSSARTSTNQEITRDEVNVNGSITTLPALLRERTLFPIHVLSLRM